MASQEKRQNPYEIELPKSIIDSFARFLAPEIQKFYASEQGQKELAECQFKLTAESEENEIVKVPDGITYEKYSRDLFYYLDKIAKLEDQVAYYKKQLEKSEKDNEKLREKLKAK